MSVFDKRAAFRPFEYPEMEGYKKSINQSYWLVEDFTFDADIHDFHARLTPPERSAIKNTLLAISQVEVSVKRFWARLGEHCPKPEIEQVGATFADSEVRHADAYSHLLQVLGLHQEFDALLRDSEPIRGRVDYLQKYINRPAADDREYAVTLALFAIMTENVSLFSQFAVVQSFWKHRKMLKDIDNVIQATRQEESVHAQFGSHLFRIIEAEEPGWFDGAFEDRLAAACQKACDAECKIIDWIFSGGGLEFVRPAVLKDYVRHRFNQGLGMIGRPEMFAVASASLDQFAWFDEEDMAVVNFDFFHKHPTTYSKHTRSFSGKDLF
jgi:ribonucleoside-diphosphate reductase beta chain